MIISIEFFRVYVLLWSCWKKNETKTKHETQMKGGYFFTVCQKYDAPFILCREQVRMDMKKGTLKTNEQQVLVEKVLCERERKRQTKHCKETKKWNPGEDKIIWGLP